MAMFRLRDDDPCLTEEFVRPASGAGGQHLNKTSNAVRLTYDYLRSPLLTEDVRERLTALAAHILSGGKLVILSKESRSLQQNREHARTRLENLINSAFQVPKKRKKTKVTRAERERRLTAKAHRSAIKQSRKKAAAE